MEASLEQRYAIKCCVHVQKSSSETFNMIFEAFNVEAMSREKWKERLEQEGDNFSKRTITADETWLYHYDPITKQEISEWTPPSSPTPKNAKTVKAAECREASEDDKRSGQPVSSRTNENFKKTLMKSCEKTKRMSDITIIDRETIRKILTENLHMVKV
ncbi:hypothetical protein TNCV_3512611 [Trichonephila clavipes]|nr:hypothetical protein TNCV_3512611 [Trichonephila clavipes]